MTKTLTVGYKDDVDTKALRKRLNKLFADLGYSAKGEYTDSDTGGLAAGLLALRRGELMVIKRETLESIYALSDLDNELLKIFHQVLAENPQLL